MFNDQTRKFTFRCEKCKEILTSSFDEDKDIEDIINGLLWLECPAPCSGKAIILKD